MTAAPSASATPPTPRPAATTLVFRAGDPFQLFMVKRAATLNFMAGTHVFPGGRVDAADAEVVEAGLLALPEADALAARMGLPRAAALAHVVAACRELLEEAGVLLARGANAELAAQARALLGTTRNFRSVLAQLGVTLDGAALSYMAHWVTPVAEPRRFSARFFAVRMPEGQHASADEQEAVSGEWLTPAHALKAHQARALVLPPPTLTLLDTLSRVKDVDAFWNNPPAVRVVEPVLVTDGDVPVLAFPGDRLHPDATGVPDAGTRVEIRDGLFVLGHAPRSHGGPP